MIFRAPLLKISTLVAVLAATGMTLLSAQAQNLTALVIEAGGKAAYVKAGTKDKQPVQVNVTRLSAGDEVLTGPSSRVKLLIEGKQGPEGAQEPTQSTVDIQERSKVRISELLADAGTGGESVRIGIAQGQIISNVRKIDTNSERFEVETPTAVAAVRGTNYGAKVKWTTPNKPKVNVFVRRGLVDILDPINRTFLRKLEEGRSLDIEPNGDMSEGSITPTSAPAPGGQQGSSGLGGIGGGGDRGDGGDSDTGNFDSERGQDEGDDTGGGSHGGDTNFR